MSDKDTIYRQDALDEIEYELEMINSALDSITLDFNAREILRQRRGEAREILNSIQQLPSAQSERKGKWIDYSDEGYVECPFCHSATNCDGNKGGLHYCFSCGAELRGEQDG